MIHDHQPFVPRFLEQSNDVERNPGPPKNSSKNGQALVSIHNHSLKRSHNCNPSSTASSSSLSGGGMSHGKLVQLSNKKIEEVTEAQNGEPPGNGNCNGNGNRNHPVVVYNSEAASNDSLKSVIERQQEQLRLQREDLDDLRRRLEENSRLTYDFKAELSEIRRNWQNINVAAANSGQNDKLTTSKKGEEDIISKLEGLTTAYNDIQDRLYEIDKSWKNNLVVYGIPCAENMDEDPLVTEEKVRDVLHKKLHISREIQMSRIARIWHGPDFRGHKPIQLCIVNYRDKEEILRKARLLKGSNIYISEDFSRKVREHRHELIKFMKEVRSRDPARRMTLRYDKLYMGHDIFFFNDTTGRVERLHQHLDMGTTTNSLIGNLFINDSQLSIHDRNWLRRPRSRNSSFRSLAPLSRQNSVSMDDVNGSPSKAHRTFNRSSASARVRRPSNMSKSVSIDSLDYDSDSAVGDDRLQYNRSNDYYYDHRGEANATPSPTKSRSHKTVAFKDVPAFDKETPRLLNGTPYHNQLGYVRVNNSADDYSDDECVMTVDTVNKTYTQTYRGALGGPESRDDSRAVALLPPSQIAPTPLPPIHSPQMLSSSKEIVPNGYHDTYDNNDDEDVRNLPAIANNSYVEMENKKMLKYEPSSDSNRALTPASTHNNQLVKVNGGPPGLNPGNNANGVFKVAMYGEFPLAKGNGEPSPEMVNGHSR